MVLVFGLVVIHVMLVIRKLSGSVQYVGVPLQDQALFLSNRPSFEVKDLRSNVAVSGALQQGLGN